MVYSYVDRPCLLSVSAFAPNPILETRSVGETTSAFSAALQSDNALDTSLAVAESVKGGLSHDTNSGENIIWLQLDLRSELYGQTLPTRRYACA